MLRLVTLMTYNCSSNWRYIALLRFLEYFYASDAVAKCHPNWVVPPKNRCGGTKCSFYWIHSCRQVLYCILMIACKLLEGGMGFIIRPQYVSLTTEAA